MRSTLEPLKIVRRSATSLEQIRADVAARFINSRFDIAPDARRGQTRTHTSLQLGGVHIDHIQAVGGLISGIKPELFELTFATQGGLRIERGQLEAVSKPDGDVVFFGGTDMRVTIETLPGSITFVLRFDPVMLQKYGRAMLGSDFKLDPHIRFDVRNGASRALARNVSAIYVELTELAKVGLSSLASQAYEHMLANFAIAALYPDRVSVSDAPTAPHRVVERAEEIISARVAEPLSLQDVAAELGVTMRTLQLEFRKHRGCTPMQFLISRRLTLAHERLLNPNFGGNVQYVAMSCGFMNMSKFASRYRAMFGELPSETLARGRRR